MKCPSCGKADGVVFLREEGKQHDWYCCHACGWQWVVRRTKRPVRGQDRAFE